MTLLASEPFCLRHRYALQADFLQGFLHLIELEWFDDRFDFLHSSVGPPLDAKQRLAARFRSPSPKRLVSPKHSLCQSPGCKFCLSIQGSVAVAPKPAGIGWAGLPKIRAIC